MPRPASPSAPWTLVTLLLAAALLAAPGFVAAWEPATEDAARGPESAWEALVAAHPEVVDDESVTPVERRVLAALTPRQAEEYLAGAAPEELVVADGRSLAEVMASEVAGASAGVSFFPLDPCRLADTAVTEPASPFAPGETRTVVVRGRDLAGQGGVAGGCGVPRRATAVEVRFLVSEADSPGSLKAWAGDAPEPAVPLVEFTPDPRGYRFRTETVVELCDRCAGGDFRLRAVGAGAQVRVVVLGYFAPLAATDLSGAIDATTLGGLRPDDLARASHTHGGGDIRGGIVREQVIDTSVARDTEVLPLVLAGDGPGSGLDADSVDGVDASELARLSDLQGLAAASDLEGLVGADELGELTPSAARIGALRWFDVNLAGVSFTVGQTPRRTLFDGRDLWVSNFDSDTVTRLSPKDGRVLATYGAGDGPLGMAYDGAHLWVAARNAGSVRKLRASDGTVVATIATGGRPSGVVFDGAAIWVSDPQNDRVLRYRPSDGALLATVPVCDAPGAMAADGASVWVACSLAGGIVRLDPQGAVLGAWPVGDLPSAIAYDGSSVWVANFGDDTVTRLDASSGSLLGTYAVADGPLGIAFDGASIWVTGSLGDAVTRLRARDGQLLGTVSLAPGSAPEGIAFDGLDLWVSGAGAAALRKM